MGGKPRAKPERIERCDAPGLARWITCGPYVIGVHVFRMDEQPVRHLRVKSGTLSNLHRKSDKRGRILFSWADDFDGFVRADAAKEEEP